MIQVSTKVFCRKFLNLKNDPCGRQFDQMTQAARSVTANIAEGCSRHQTSRETEMKLLDVARASLSELMGDYFNWLLEHGQAPWKKTQKEYIAVNTLEFDAPNYGNDLQHDVAAHILAQKKRFDPWLESEDPVTSACSMMVAIDRCATMLEKLISKKLSEFKEEGGFSENLTKERIATQRNQSIEANAPQCPLCGKPMLKRVAKRGANAGQPFWSCSEYPNCHGTRKA